MGRGQDLLEAARNGDVTVANKILQSFSNRIGALATFRRSPRINIQDVNGYTPLHHACLNGHLNIVFMLLAHEAALDIPDIRGSTPLYLAAWAGHHDIVKTLLMHPTRPANPNVQTIDNETPLHCAAQHGHNVVLAILLAYGADPTIRNDSFQTPLDLAAQYGRLQIVQMLIRTHPELILTYTCSNSDDESENLAQTKHIFTHTCLHLASRNGHKKVVEALLTAGINVNVMTIAGSALHEAALCGKKSVAKVLLKAGIDVNAIDGNGRTAMELLNDYPPHVTYELVTLIRKYCKENSEKNCTQSNEEISENKNQNENSDGPGSSRTFPKDMKNKRNANNEDSMPKNTKKNGLSNSLSSLQEKAVTPEFYLKMKPIIPQKIVIDNIVHNGAKGSLHDYYKPIQSTHKINGKDPVFKEIAKNQSATLPARSYDQIYLARSGKLYSDNDDKSTSKPYKCVDEYVVMTEPIQSNEPSPSNSNEIKTPQPAPRNIEYGDYANINTMRNSKQLNKTQSEEENVEVETPSNDVNNNKGHSPTPEFPPPSVDEAENTILEFIQPTSLKRNYKFIFPENSEMFGSPDSLSSLTSDNVEKFVGDDPFAGLFKGSTLNLACDEIDGGETAHRLRSPSLVKAIKPIPAKRSISKQRDCVDSNEGTNATNDWDEINSILESIGNEVASASLNDVDSEKNTLPTTKDLQKHLKMRNPSDLIMGTTEGTVTNWRHSAVALLNGQITYEVYYLGSTVIKQLRGTASTRKSIQKLKFIEKEMEEGILQKCNNSTKIVKENNKNARLKVEIAISHTGVKFIDHENKSTISIHDIENINCVCQDDDLRHFAYITKEGDMHYCHVFMVDDLELAAEIILTLGQAFEIAYQMALNTKVDRIQEEPNIFDDLI